MILMTLLASLDPSSHLTERWLKLPQSDAAKTCLALRPPGNI